jgi:hypothetical protein
LEYWVVPGGVVCCTGWWNTDRPVLSVMAVGSENPRTPGSVPK